MFIARYLNLWHRHLKVTLFSQKFLTTTIHVNMYSGTGSLQFIGQGFCVLAESMFLALCSSITWHDVFSLNIM